MSRKATNEYIGESNLLSICEYYSDYRNFCVPCKMLVEKIKRKHGKGYTCKYDKPQTQYARALAASEVPQSIKEPLQRRKSKINGIELYHKLLKNCIALKKCKNFQKNLSRGRDRTIQHHEQQPPQESVQLLMNWATSPTDIECPYYLTNWEIYAQVRTNDARARK